MRPTVRSLLLSKIHRCHLQARLRKRNYTLRCRTINDNGAALPMPRPFRKSGHAKIEAIRFDVKSVEVANREKSVSVLSEHPQ